MTLKLYLRQIELFEIERAPPSVIKFTEYNATVIWVQILDKGAYISRSVNIFGKGMHKTILSPSVGK